MDKTINRTFAIASYYVIKALTMLDLPNANYWWMRSRSELVSTRTKVSTVVETFVIQNWFNVPTKEGICRIGTEVRLNKITHNGGDKDVKYELVDVFLAFTPSFDATIAVFVPDELTTADCCGLRLDRSQGRTSLSEVVTNQQVDDIKRAANLLFSYSRITGIRSRGSNKEAGGKFRLRIVCLLPYNEGVEIGLDGESRQWIVFRTTESKDHQVTQFLNDLGIFPIQKKPIPHVRDSREGYVFHITTRTEEGDHIRLDGYVSNETSPIFFYVPKDITEVELAAGEPLGKLWILWDVGSDRGWVSKCKPPRNTIVSS